MAMAHALAPRSAPMICAMMLAAAFHGEARAQDKAPLLLPHRAVYDLTLGESRGNSQVVGVRGRILYDFAGNVCDGYSLQFRQVSELDSGEGKTTTSDLRSTTWEGGDAKHFIF